MTRDGTNYGTRRRIGAIAALALIASALGFARLPTANAAGIASTTEFSVPAGSNPWGTAFNSAGQVWVALPGCDPAPSCAPTTPPGKLGLFDPTTNSWVATVSLPTGYGQPLFVAVDHNGKVWFTMPVTNTIGMFDPVTAAVTQWTIPTANGGPWDLAIDANNKIWFTEHYVNKIGEFDPVSQTTLREVSTPATNSDPYGITIDKANNVWFTENNDAVALIAEYTHTGVFQEYKIRNGATAGSGLTPHLITVGAGGNIWWSEGFVGGIGTLKVAAAQPGTNLGVTEYRYTPACASCGTHTSGIAFDGGGRIWLDDSLQNTFGSFLIGDRTFSFYNSPGSHPHDGLNVDIQDRIWFDEEFANQLAEASIHHHEPRHDHV